MGDAQFRPNDVDDALNLVFDVVEGHAKVRAVLAQSLHLCGRVGRPQGDVHADAGRDGVIHCGEGLVRAAHRQPPLPQFGESLGRGHFVDQMGVDVEHRGRARVLGHDVGLPDFFKECLSRHGCGLLIGGTGL